MATKGMIGMMTPDTESPSKEIDLEKILGPTPARRAAMEAQAAAAMAAKQQELQQAKELTMLGIAGRSGTPNFGLPVARGQMNSEGLQQAGGQLAQMIAGMFGRKPQAPAPAAPAGPDPRDPYTYMTDPALQSDDPFNAYEQAAQRMVQAGMSMGDVGLIQQGYGLMQYAQEGRAKLQNKQATTRGTLASAEQTEQENRFERSGAEYLGPTEDGKKRYGYRVKPGTGNWGKNLEWQTTEGVDRIVTDVRGNDPRTDSQVGEDYQAFDRKVRGYDYASSQMIKIMEGMSKFNAKQGWAANVVHFFDNVLGTAKQTFPNNVTMTVGAEEALRGYDKEFQNMFQATGVNKARWVDLVSILAKTYNPTGTITERDIDRAMGAIGANYSDPETVVKVLQDRMKTMDEDVDRDWGYMTPNSRSGAQHLYDTYRSNRSKMKDPTSPTPARPAPGAYSDPAKEARYREWLKSQGVTK